MILDLDGVVTRTAALHRQAWKATFDRFLRREHPEQAPFDEGRDYDEHVDGKPRLDGVRDFLASRGIERPEGDEDDTLADATIHGIGNAKNDRFRELLDEDGAEVFQDALARLRAWKQKGVRLAIVSSSRNCRRVLESAGLDGMFDARVDGVTLGERGLRGKPAPDMYLEAARRLGVKPSRCAVIEDALAGVEGARRGGFGLVVGVDRGRDRADELGRHGAHVVVTSLDDRHLDAITSVPAPPRLLDDLDGLRRRIADRRPVLFLDYDGTLTPIVSRPELAKIGGDMRERLREAASRFTVAIVSGRDREDVQALVGIDDLVYAGSHGFDIRGPSGLRIEHDVGVDAVPALDAAERALERTLGQVPGAQIERKRFSVAVHYRNVDEPEVKVVEAAVDEAIDSQAGLRKAHGKKVFEIQPDVDWDKGRAVLWLLDALGLDSPENVPIYAGDDVTDEDAFEAIEERGIGVLVAEEVRPTAATYLLRDVDEVGEFLRWLARTDERKARGETA